MEDGIVSTVLVVIETGSGTGMRLESWKWKGMGTITSFPHTSTGCANKNNSLDKRLYFSNGSTHLSHTFRFYVSVFTQYILQISLKQLM